MSAASKDLLIILWKCIKIAMIIYAIFFPNLLQTNRNQLEKVVEATYDIHLNLCFQILNLKIGGKSLVTRCFGLHSNFRGTGEIKRLCKRFCKRFLYLDTRNHLFFNYSTGAEILIASTKYTKFYNFEQTLLARMHERSYESFNCSCH